MTKLGLYKIAQQHASYGDYCAAIVVAKSAEDAKLIHPQWTRGHRFSGDMVFAYLWG